MSSEPGRLRLFASAQDDLSVISALLQDALVPLGDMAYLPEEKSFMMALNRFRWEAAGDSELRERVHAGLRFDRVNRVRYRGIDRRQRGHILSLLAIAHEDGVLTLHFSGDGVIRLEAEELRCALEDFGEPWPTRSTPHHDSGDT
jgi:hypothetical protein